MQNRLANTLWNTLVLDAEEPVSARDRRQARLARVIRAFLDNGYPLLGECTDPSEHLAQEILNTVRNWI